MDDAARGDIVLYIVDRSSGIIGHSARITDPDLDNLTVKSKWDFMGVYEHPADYCPYAEDIDGLMIAQRT